jgi:hypothetical protein
VRRARTGARRLALALPWLLVAGGARGATQDLHFPSAPAWYFVALQLTPENPDPLAVFPVGGGFAYDHVWSYDAQAGWRHFAPPDAGIDAAALPAVNDLSVIEPLRGHWIHVTRVPAGGFDLRVEGVRADVQRLAGGAWHATGALGDPSASPSNVQGIFSELGAELAATISQVWRYDESAAHFQEITDFSADCGTAPDQCFGPGTAFWVLTAGDVALGQVFEVSARQLLLGPEAKPQRLRFSYTGAGSLAATLRPAGAGTGLRFFPALDLVVDGQPYDEPDLAAARADGPDTELDLAGDGEFEPCPRACATAADCVDLCFENASRSHSVFVQLDAEALASLETFTSLDGRLLTTLEVRRVAPGTPQDGALLATVPLAAKPPVVTGEYAGFLVYEDGSGAQVPIRMLLDDCVQGAGTGRGADCSGSRATAVINPRIVGSDANGIDDDGDADLDEPDEAGAVVPTRDAPGFPVETVLHGSLSEGNQLLRLRGAIAGVDDLPVSVGAASIFRESARTLSLVGRRTRAMRFAGSFVDRYDDVALAGDPQIAARGRFEVERVRAPQCVARDPGSTRSLPLGVPCRADADCPRRCTGSGGEGLACTQDGDCVVELDGSSVDVGPCEPYGCAFRELPAGSASARAFQHGALRVPLAVSVSGGGDFGTLVLQVEGLDGAVALGTASNSGGVDFGELPCGSYMLRVTSARCTEVLRPIGICGRPVAPVPVSCAAASAPVAARSPLLAGAAGVALLGSSAGIGPSGVQLVREAQGVPQPCTPLAGVACTALYEPFGPSTGPGATPVTLRAALGEIAGAARDPVAQWTDLLEWPPLVALRTGLLGLLESPASDAP